MAKTSKTRTWRATFRNGKTLLITKKCLAKAENTLNKARDFESLEALAARHYWQCASRYMKKKVRKFRHWRKWLELAERFKEVE